MRPRYMLAAVSLVFTLACGMTSLQREANELYVEEDFGSPPSPSAESRPAPQKGSSRRSPPRPRASEGTAEDAVAAAPEAEPPEQDNGSNDSTGQQARTWFPETFLWEPHIETDDAGYARLDVRVPDQLTTWRILALAHTQGGRTGGALHRFDSTLPLYVDPVVPAWLHAGDTVRIPIQAVGLSQTPSQATVRVEATGALLGSSEFALTVPADGSTFEHVTLTAVSAGEATVRADLTGHTGTDAAERRVPVIPTGRPVMHTRGGTLTGTSQIKLQGPTAADLTTQQLQVRVFPGPLAVLQAEVERALLGTVPSGYGFVLATQLGTLAERAGQDVDADAIRRLQILGWQRIAQAARQPDAGVAADLLATVRGARGHTLAEKLTPRLVETLIRSQRGDGTWGRSDQAALQQILVQTAWAARALPASATTARLRAAGALERYAASVDDAYTAAAFLSTGLLDADQAAPLIDQVKEAVTLLPTGSVAVAVPSDVHNPWGYRPTVAEMLAWTWLAAHKNLDSEASGAIIASLMEGYDARSGFGAGVADILALEAIIGGLPLLDQPVEVALQVDGEVVARASVDPTQPKVPALLEASPGTSSPTITLRTEPPVPGLAYVAQLASWVPWSGSESIPGVDVDLSLDAATVGRAATVTMMLAAPAGTSLDLQLGVPAGATIDPESLHAQQGSGGLARFTVELDRVRLVTNTFAAGEVIELRVRITPAFAGRFATHPLVVGVSGTQYALPPLEWRVSPEERG